MTLGILRLGHRPQRDKRITTHVCLTARALGAKFVWIAEEDESIAKSVADVAGRFGGDFEIKHATGWKGPVKAWKKAGGKVVHLTMYGETLAISAAEITADGADLLIVVGAEKVPGDLYKMADWNVAVGNQPHSEVAALALLMDRLRGGQWEADEFPGAAIEVVPSRDIKRVRAAPHPDEPSVQK